MSRNKIPWGNVRVYTDEGDIVEYERSRELLRGYRNNGGIPGYWLAIPGSVPDEELWNVGPAVEDIDWTGIDNKEGHDE